MNAPVPRISVVVAVYNMADTLQRCIDSVKCQTYRNKELIVIEGASTDGTVGVLKANQDVIDHWESVQASARGIYTQWNRALDHTTGEWIYFLGADDRLLRADVLSKVAPWLRRAKPETDLVYGPIVLVSETGTPVEVLGQPWSLARRTIATSMPIPHPGTFHRATSFERYGRFDERFRVSGDLDFCLRVLKASEPEFIHDTMINAMTIGGRSLDPDRQVFVIKEGARARRNNGMTPYPLAIRRRLLRARVRRMIALTLGDHAVRFAEDLYSRITGSPPPLHRR